MRLVIQRVTGASVSVNSKLISEIKHGLCVLVGIGTDDTKEDAEYCVRKILNTRLWDDQDKRTWRKSVSDMKYEILLVSQFTLFAKLKGNKPDFHEAMPGDKSKEFFENFVKMVQEAYIAEKVKVGAFGEYMNVNIENDGPVTIFIDSKTKFK